MKTMSNSDKRECGINFIAFHSRFSYVNKFSVNVEWCKINI